MEAFRREPNVTPQELLIKRVVEAWGQADIGPIRDALHDEVIWKSASTMKSRRFRFGGTYMGRAEVISHLSKLSTAYFFSGYDAKEIVSRGEIVWALFNVRGIYRQPGSAVPKKIDFETAFRFCVRDQKIIEGQVFFDTLALLAQQGELHEAIEVA